MDPQIFQDGDPLIWKPGHISALSYNKNIYLWVQIKILNNNSSVDHRPMSETSDSSFIEHYFTES